MTVSRISNFLDKPIMAAVLSQNLCISYIGDFRSGRVGHYWGGGTGFDLNFPLTKECFSKGAR
jgi:hypothetical protein